MRRDTLVQLAAALAMLGFMGASVALTPRVAASVGRHRLVYTDTAEQGERPEVALGIAMGAFRGMFVNFLWMRANTLKEEGKYYEAVNLSKTITRLQPRFPKVWAFHGWNLAYNISVSTQTPQERWNWVNAGVNLLRSEGIPANPNDLTLHKELAWIHLHKIQGVMDDAHWYYKRQFAREWTGVMGPPPKLGLARVGTDEAAELFVTKWLQPIADAPNTMAELEAAAPGVPALIERIRRETRLELDSAFLERVAEAWSFIDTAVAIGRTEIMGNDPLVAIMADPSTREAGKLLVNHVRKRTLIDRYNMEPDRMIRYTRKFGPLDWRHPAAHAVYWSHRGVEQALLRAHEGNKQDYDFLNTDRVTIQSIQELFRTSDLYYDILNPQFILGLPNAFFIDSYSNLIDEIAERAKASGRESDTRTYNFYAAGYENFLRDSIRFLYRRGDKEQAERYYKKLREWPHLNISNPMVLEELQVPLAEFVVNEVRKENRETVPAVAIQEISGAMQVAYVSGLLGGNTRAFTEQMNYARLFYDEYQKTQGFKTAVAGSQGRMGFPPFDILAASTFTGLIQSVGVPQGPQMYRAAPPDLQCRTYAFLELTELKAALGGAAEEQGVPGFDTWFPPPAGVEACRAQVQQQIQSQQARPEGIDAK